jgi:hypothetical protein
MGSASPSNLGLDRLPFRTDTTDLGCWLKAANLCRADGSSLRPCIDLVPLTPLVEPMNVTARIKSAGRI